MVGLVKSIRPYKFAVLLMALALIAGGVNYLVSALHYTTFDIGPAPDQIRDAFVYQGMVRGTFPSLGPGSSVGGYSLPPLYYFLAAPAALLGADPAFTVLPNALFSFASIPLFMGLIYTLLANVSATRRFTLTGVAGLWYALLYPLIFISTFQWNPSPIPFFLFAFALLYRVQWKAQASLTVQVICWIAYGMVQSILVSLHSATMFVIPAIYLGSLVVYWVKHRKHPQKWGLPFTSLAAAIAILLPYWQGELGRGFANTKQVIRAIIGGSDGGESPSLIGRLGRILWNYAELGWQSYFIGDTSFHKIIAVIFVFAVLGLALIKFRGDRVLFNFLAAVWVVYLLAASSYTEAYVIHYKLLILVAPIIFSMIVLAYRPLPKLPGQVVSVLISTGIVASMISNLAYDGAYLSSKFSRDRALSSTDVIHLLQALPPGSTLCDPRFERWRTQHHIGQYIDQYITRQALTLSQTCEPNNYLIEPKVVYLFKTNNVWPAFQTRKLVPLNQTLEAPITLVNETPAARLYQFEASATLDYCYSFVGDRYIDSTCSNLEEL